MFCSNSNETTETTSDPKKENTETTGANEPLEAAMEEESEESEDQATDMKKLRAMPPLDYFNKSFEAMWYQAEVLHKREVEKWDAAEKKWTENEKRYESKLGEVEANLKVGILNFTKEILEMIQDFEIHNETKLEKILQLLESFRNITTPV